MRYLQKQLAQHPRMIPELRAYVVYALSLAGAKNLGPSVETLWSRRSDLSAEGLALTGMAMLRAGDNRAPQIAQLLEAKAQHTGTLVSWPSSYNPLLDLNDDNSAESTAFALRFLTHADAEEPVAAKALRSGWCSIATADTGGTRPSKPPWCSLAWWIILPPRRS